MTERAYEVDGRAFVSLADKDDNNERAIRRYERHLDRMVQSVVDSLSLEVALQFEKDVQAAIDRRIAELTDASKPRAERYSFEELAADTSRTGANLHQRAARHRKAEVARLEAELAAAKAAEIEAEAAERRASAVDLEG